ncbi:MAG: hypothetical protein IT353_00055 [Gemmatimonadaceae bacterium]|nr:hypothetical protein [Gemmatimonadaceae bacterium]
MANPDVAALLVVQQDDETIRAIEARHEALAPRLVAMDKARQRAIDEVNKNATALERELEKQRTLEARATEHRDRLAKSTAMLDQAHKVKEATAAIAQVETAKRVVAEDDTELLATSRRITDLRTSTTAARDALATLETDQAAARAVVTADRAEIAAELEAARSRRAISATAVSASLFSKYDRLQARRRAPAFFALQGFSCGSCDTAIPMQRRPAMSSGQVIEVCEGCGVLLYLPVPPAAT